MQALQINLIPLRKALISGHHNELYVLVNVTLNEELASQKFDRPKLKIAYILDRSGSMSGRRLNEAKKCIQQSLSMLSPQDEMALISYDDEVRLDLPLNTVENQLGTIDQILQGIESGGSTNLSDGWIKGADILVASSTQAHENSCLKRVFLLSDGQANRGVCLPGELRKIGQNYWEKGVSTSTFGIGLGFNEVLMSNIAKSSAGSGFFGETANDLSDPFGSEIHALAETFAHSIKLSIQPRNEKIKIKQINDFNEDEKGIDLLPLTLGAKSWAILKCTILEDELQSSEDLFKVVVTGLQLNNGDLLSSEAKMAALPVVDLNVYQAIAESEEVQKALSEAQMTEDRRVILNALENRNWTLVKDLILKLKSDAERTQSEWKKKLLTEMEKLLDIQDYETFQKELFFSTEMMSKQRKLDSKFLLRQSQTSNRSVDDLISQKRYLYEKSSSRKND